MFAILGSGFGLYGYLPALIGVGEDVILPQRYAARFATRRELACFAPQIHWAQDAPDALDQADGVVIALRPADQCEWAAKCLARSRISRLILENPLAPTPEAAGALHRDLVRSGKAFRIGYTFRYTPWAADLRASCRTPSPAELVIRWSFLPTISSTGSRTGSAWPPKAVA